MLEEVATKENLRLLVEGKLTREEVKKLIRLSPKDKDRFWKYLEVLQERVPWTERILLRISEHLYIVSKKEGGRIVKCDCGHEFGDYRCNWKLASRIFVRTTAEEMSEVISVDEAIPNVGFMEMREFYCPTCLTLLGVEVVPQGYPLIFEMLPDLDSFYRIWLGKPLEDEHPNWYQDRTADVTAKWAEEA